MDARLPERFLADRRFLRLSDAGFRAAVTALIWSVSNRTDGYLDDTDLTLLPRVSSRGVKEIQAEGILVAHGGGWLLTDYESTQTSRDEIDRLERIRKAEREKKQRQRAERALDGAGDGPGDVSPGQHRKAGKELLTDKEEPPRGCDQHPNGATAKCGGCAEARRIHDDWKRRQPTVPGLLTTVRNPDDCTHKADAAGWCVLCGAQTKAGAA